jgi:hypothetical protein
VFSNGADRERQDRESEVRELHAKIGQLMVERDLYEGLPCQGRHDPWFGDGRFPVPFDCFGLGRAQERSGLAAGQGREAAWS